MGSATGQVFVTDVSYNALIDSFAVAGGVGVNETDCSFGPMKSYPFAVVIAQRAPKYPPVPGMTLVTLEMGVSNRRPA